MALLEIRDLAVVYEVDKVKFSAVNGVSLKIERGETLGLWVRPEPEKPRPQRR
jgi:ABC-type dipeptide/oligopeptide/nickel transport system ATPase subunit